VVVLSLTLSVSVMAQQTGSAGNASRKTQVDAGAKMKVKGIVIKRDDSRLFLRDYTGAQLTVRLAANTKLEEKKGNPFRGGKKYSTTQLSGASMLKSRGAAIPPEILLPTRSNSTMTI
jgi:hypothetical protein